MTQRIFDIENEKDMQDLWEIFPHYIDTIRGMTRNDSFLLSKGKLEMKIPANLIAINWHDKTEITRPVDYEKMVGCVGWFWDEYEETSTIGILTEYKQLLAEPFIRNSSTRFSYFRPAKKSELKFWGE